MKHRNIVNSAFYAEFITNSYCLLCSEMSYCNLQKSDRADDPAKPRNGWGSYRGLVGGKPSKNVGGHADVTSLVADSDVYDVAWVGSAVSRFSSIGREFGRATALPVVLLHIRSYTIWIRLATLTISILPFCHRTARIIEIIKTCFIIV